MVGEKDATAPVIALEWVDGPTHSAERYTTSGRVRISRAVVVHHSSLVGTVAGAWI